MGDITREEWLRAKAERGHEIKREEGLKQNFIANSINDSLSKGLDTFEICRFYSAKDHNEALRHVKSEISSSEIESVLAGRFSWARPRVTKVKFDIDDDDFTWKVEIR